MIKVSETTLPGVVIVEPEVFSDARGLFMETFNAIDFAKFGLPVEFVQDNTSRSVRGVLRGLHYQYPLWQGKLIRVLSGNVFDVAVDIRRASSTFGKWLGVELTSNNHKQLYIPPGYAHGFCVLSEEAELAYKCTTTYQPTDDKSILWNDPDIDIDWPIDHPLLSEKDESAPLLVELPELSV